METLNGLKRTHYCGDLRDANIDEEVVLMGWVQKKRNVGGLVFVGAIYYFLFLKEDKVSKEEEKAA